MFFIRGASWRLPLVFWSEGTGWYVRKAVRISGKTANKERTMSIGWHDGQQSQQVRSMAS